MLAMLAGCAAFVGWFAMLAKLAGYAGYTL
jgi:hypothetical protein